MIKPPLHTLKWLALMLLLSNCEEKTDWDLDSTGEFMIADCIITNEMKTHELKLYRSINSLNQTTEGISGAVINLSDGLITIAFQQDQNEPGRYLSSVPFMAAANRTYQLTIFYQGLYDTAYANMVGVSPLKDLTYEPSDGYFRYTFQEEEMASMTEVFYNWAEDPGYCQQYGSCAAAEVFYSLNNIDVGKLFPPEKQVILFPHNTEIIRRKYSLEEEHQGFIRSLLLETEWRGGFFDVEQGNVPTNFRHGVRGWFAACSVVSDTTYFE